MSANEKQIRLAGRPEEIPVLRRFVGDLLGANHPSRQDAELLASEAGTNAITHSASGRPGGTFRLCVEWAEGWARVAVADQGSPSSPCLRRMDKDGVSGRGIALLDELSSRWGFTRRSTEETEVWFVVGECPSVDSASGSSL